MTLLVETPNTRVPERDYILGVLLDDFLGFPWRRVPSERKDVRITVEGQHGEVLLPDNLFSVPEDDWLTDASMPVGPLARWDTRELADEITLVEPVMPLIYGDREPVIQREGEKITLPVDVFGSAFFMLSRYEEVVTKDRDAHNRFPAWASIAYKQGFLDRPVVDEYVEILWTAMIELWPNLKRKQHEFRMLVSCDVDSALRFRGSVRDFVRTLGRDLIKQRSASLAVRNISAAIRTWLGYLDADPHWYGLKWIMEVNEKAGNRVAFYFIPEVTDTKKDNPVSNDDSRVRAMLREMARRGHEIGVHPGYDTYKNEKVMGHSIGRFKQVMTEEGINQSIFGGRQHFLRWETPTTARFLAQNNLDYDTSLGFADRPGFRSGTCREYLFFDILERKELDIYERPLIVMECTVIADKYMGLGYAPESISLMMNYKSICEKFSGNFSLLWHNSYLKSSADFEFYSRLVQPL